MLSRVTYQILTWARALIKKVYVIPGSPFYNDLDLTLYVKLV